MKQAFRRYVKTALSVLLIFSLVIPYAQAAMPDGVAAPTGAVSDTAVPSESEEEVSLSEPEEAAPRSLEELKTLDGVTLDASGRALSVKADTPLSNAELRQLLLNYDENTPKLMTLPSEDDLERSILENLQEQFGFSEDDIEAAVALHGDMGRFQHELRYYNTTREHREIAADMEAALLRLICGGYTASQAFGAYAACNVLNCSIDELLQAKREERMAEEDETQTAEERDSDIDELSTRMGVPYSIVEEFMAGYGGDCQDLKAEYRAASVACYDRTETESAPAGLLSSSNTNYAPEQILDEPFTYSTVGTVDVNLNTGDYKFTETDLTIPGVNGLDLNITRIFDSGSSNYNTPIGMYEVDYDEGNENGDVITLVVGAKCFLWTNYDTDDKAPVFTQIADMSPYTFADQEVNELLKIERRSEYQYTTSEYAMAAENAIYANQAYSCSAYATDSRGNGYVFVVNFEVRPYDLDDFDWAFGNYVIDDRYLIDEFGLGHGWRLGFSAIETYYGGYDYDTRQRLITADGQKYTIEDFSGNTANFENRELKDMVLSRAGNSYPGAEYMLTYQDGRREYFNSDGRNIAIVDRFGNKITLEYTVSAGEVKQIKITDTLGNVVIYKDEDVDPARKRIPNVSSTAFYNNLWTLSLNGEVIRSYYVQKNDSNANKTNYQLSGVGDELEQVALYKYTSRARKFNSYVLSPSTNDNTIHSLSLSSIKYPNGLEKRFQLVPSSPVTGYIPPERLGTAGYIDSFQLKEYREECELDGVDLFGVIRNYTYGDYGFCYSPIYDAFEYETVLQHVLMSPERKTWRVRDERYLFDGQHLNKTLTVNAYTPVQTERISSGEQQMADQYPLYVSEVSNYRYNDNYLPTNISTKLYKWGTSNFRTQTRSYSYDNKGNLLTETYPNGQTAAYTYSGDYSIPLTKTYKQDASTTITEENTLTADKKSVATHEVKVNGTASARTGYTCDTKGRLTNQRVYTDNTNYTEQTLAYGSTAAGPVEQRTLNVKDAQGVAVAGSPGYSAGVLAEKTTYNERGLPIKLTDANGNATTFNYDSMGRVTRTDYPGGAYEHYVYDDKNSTVTFTDRLGTVYRYQYDGFGDLREVFDVALNRPLKTNTYNSMGMPILEVAHTLSGNDKNTYYYYDTRDRVIETGVRTGSKALLYQETYAYDDSTGKTTKTVVGDSSAPSVVTTSYTDVMGNTVKTGRMLNGTELVDTFTYDYLGNCTQNKSAYTAGVGGAFTTKTAYDYAGRAISVTNALNETAATGYDWQGNQISATDPKGSTSLYTYDALGRLLTQRVPFEGTAYAATRYSYDPNGSVTAKAVQNNAPAAAESWTSAEYAYDSMNQLVRVTGHADASHPSYTQYYYDKAGNILRMYTGQTAPLTITGLDRVSGTVDSVTKYGYDAYGNQTSMTDPLGKSETYTYDLNGLPLTKTDRNSILTQWVYDEMGRTIEVSAREISRPHTLSADTEIVMRYAGRDAQVSASNFMAYYPNAEESQDQYGNYLVDLGKSGSIGSGGRGWAKLSVTSPGTCSYLRIKSYTNLEPPSRDPSKIRVYGDLYIGPEWEDDTSDAMEEVIISTGYTLTGQKRDEREGKNSTTYRYDSMGRLIKETAGSTVKEYTYNKADLRTSFTLKVNNVQQFSNTYGYDALGRLVTVSGSNVSATYGYDANGNQSYVQYGNGLREEYVYNKANLVTQVANKKGSTVLSRYDYAYLLDGNQRTKTELDGTVTSYAYDGLSRLLTENAVKGGKTVSGHTYTYDSRNNRASMAVTGAENLRVNYTYDKANRLLKSVGTPTGGAAETTAYTYDNNGNRLTATSPGLDGKMTYGYDGFNRQTSVTGGRHTSAYTYGPVGLRTGKTVDGKSTSYVWDGQQIVLEQSTTTTKYVRGLNLIANIGTATSYYLYNAHGDVVQLANTTGTVTKTYRYDAFGVEEAPASGDTNPFRYCGEQYDPETGTVYLRARYYDVGNGRFTTEDSVRGEVTDPLSLNLYTYCYNNPIIYQDPSGHIIKLSSKATDEQKLQYERAILYLKSSEKGAEVIKLLEASKTTFTIKFIYDDNDRYEPLSNSIYWNMSRGLIVGDDKSVFSPALALVHEMGHGVQHLDGVLDDFLNGNKTRDQIEANNLTVHEIPIAEQLGEYVRKDYYDESGMYTVDNSTDWGTIGVHPWWYYIAPWNWGQPSEFFENKNPWSP